MRRRGLDLGPTGRNHAVKICKGKESSMYLIYQLINVKYFRFHALWHAGASLLDNSGVNTGSIQRILGHENRSTTDNYLNAVVASERVAIDVFAKANQSFEEKSYTDSHTETA